MAQYRIHDPEELLECPYDRVHMVRAKRFQYHLMKCRKNYTGSDFEKCPFNARHHVPKPEFRHHLANCPDKAIVEPEMSYNQRRENGEDNTLKGCTDTPVYRDIDIPASEDWDSDIATDSSAYYDRVHFRDLTSTNHVLRDSQPGRQYMDVENVNQNAETENLRLPKTSAMAARTGQPQIQPKPQPVSSVFMYSVGQGRGRGRGGINPTAGPGAQAAPANGAAGAFAPRMPVVGTGRGMVPTALGGDRVAPPPGFCVPKVDQSPGTTH